MKFQLVKGFHKGCFSLWCPQSWLLRDASWSKCKSSQMYFKTAEESEPQIRRGPRSMRGERLEQFMGVFYQLRYISH